MWTYIIGRLSTLGCDVTVSWQQLSSIIGNAFWLKKSLAGMTSSRGEIVLIRFTRNMLWPEFQVIRRSPVEDKKLIMGKFYIRIFGIVCQYQNKMSKDKMTLRLQNQELILSNFFFIKRRFFLCFFAVKIECLWHKKILSVL